MNIVAGSGCSRYGSTLGKTISGSRSVVDNVAGRIFGEMTSCLEVS